MKTLAFYKQHHILNCFKWIQAQGMSLSTLSFTAYWQQFPNNCIYYLILKLYHQELLQIFVMVTLATNKQHPHPVEGVVEPNFTQIKRLHVADSSGSLHRSRDTSSVEIFILLSHLLDTESVTFGQWQR